MKTIGDKIKEIRTKINMTQTQLAELSNVSIVSIRKYEANERVPKYEKLIAIANALNVDIKMLKTVEDDKTPIKTHEEIAMQYIIDYLMISKHHFKEMTPNELKELIYNLTSIMDNRIKILEEKNN